VSEESLNDDWFYAETKWEGCADAPLVYLVGYDVEIPFGLWHSYLVIPFVEEIISEEAFVKEEVFRA